MTNKTSHPALKTLNKYKELVWTEIENYLYNPVFPNTFKIPPKYKKDEQFYWKINREYPERKGKYLRPTLLLLTCEAMGNKPQTAIKTAAAMQVSEDWILIHDDLEDDSEMRRGKPTLHKKYGIEQAINAGDALHVIMWKILADNKKLLSEEKADRIMEEFYVMLMRTTLGQSVEIKWTKEENIILSDKDWFFIADGKTSYYTIAGPMRLGAIIANANRSQLDSLAKFGSHLGKCFQLVDDILDLTSDFKGLKKQIGNDIYEGKRTLILGHLLRNINSKDKKRLLAILRKSREEKNEDEVKWVIFKMHEYKSIEYAQKLANYFKKRALEIFEKDLKFLSVQPARSHLEEIINFILERDH